MQQPYRQIAHKHGPMGSVIGDRDFYQKRSVYDVNAMAKEGMGFSPDGGLYKVSPENMGDLASIGSRLDKPIVGGVAFRGEGDEIKDLSLTDQCVGKYGIAYKQIILNHK